MDINRQKELFSLAYIHSITSVAGFATSVRSPDIDSVDLSIHAKSKCGTILSPQLDVQLKCSANYFPENEFIRFPLIQKNYDELRGEFYVPRILVLLTVPKELNNWLIQNEESLMLKKCAYWISLKDFPDNENDNKTTIRIPCKNKFTVESLKKIMNDIGEKGGL